MKSRFAPLAALLAVTLLTPLAQAQTTTPGTAALESSVGSDVISLFSLAGQLYPSVFNNGSSWHSYSGYLYKYFPAAGIYAGVKDGNVYLIGGTYGNDLISRGTVAAITSALQKAAGTATTPDFSNIISVKTTADLPRLFEEFTLEWSGAGLTSQLKMERAGVEQTSGVSTEHLKITLSGTNLTAPILSEMWVDAQGNVKRYISNGFEYAPAQAAVIGPSLVSGMLISLAGADNPTIRNLIENELKNPVVTSKTSKKAIGGGSYDSLSITVASTITTELTSFGSFTMVTQLQTNPGTVLAGGFKVLSLKLR